MFRKRDILTLVWFSVVVRGRENFKKMCKFFCKYGNAFYKISKDMKVIGFLSKVYSLNGKSEIVIFGCQESLLFSCKIYMIIRNLRGFLTNIMEENKT